MDYDEEQSLPLLNSPSRPTNLDLASRKPRHKRPQNYEDTSSYSLLKNLQNESKNFYHKVMQKLISRSSEEENFDYDWLENLQHDESDVVFNCCNSLRCLSHCISPPSRY